MKSGPQEKRAYDSSRRSEQSRQTRSRILDAARELLLADGYAAMTVPSLAEHAAVSPQTIYNSIGGKAEVVKAVYDRMLAGDDAATPMSERPAFRAVVEAPDESSYARAYAAWCRGIWDRVGPLLGVLMVHGPGGDRSLEEFMRTIDTERRTGNANGLRNLFARRDAADREFERVVDAVWALTAPEIYDRLVRRAGWTSASYEQWLAAQLAAALGESDG